MTNEYRSLKDHVYNHIVDLIDGGTLADDHKISEQQICDALGVSRTPVREALIQLAADGYLENVPRKGFYVKRVTAPAKSWRSSARWTAAPRCWPWAT